MSKVIITVAPIGGGATRADNPAMPITPDEILEETLRCYHEGASIVHYHARDPVTGVHERDGRKMNELQSKYIKLVREKCDIVINLTTGGGRTEVGGMYGDPAKDLEVMEERLKLRPEIASLNMGTLNSWFREGGVFLNTVPWIEQLANLMNRYNIKPELEVYDTGMINTAIELSKKGVLKPPLHFQFVMGAWTGIQATVKNLLLMYEMLPPGSTWSVCALGRFEFPMVTTALLLGGNVRVGFEDNLRLSRNELAPSNAALVAKAVRIAKELGHEIATPGEARDMLGLQKSSKHLVAST